MFVVRWKLYFYTEFRHISLFSELVKAGNIRTCYKYNRTAHSRRYQYEHRILRWCSISCLGHVQYTTHCFTRAERRSTTFISAKQLSTMNSCEKKNTCINIFNRNPFSRFAGIESADEKTDRRFIFCVLWEMSSEVYI
jgi:hypothetical protein